MNQKTTVLVVDDIPSLRTLYQACLDEAGYRSVGAKSATEGLELFRRSGAQVVLLDMVLPDRDGLDLMQEMLALRPTTAIIVVTADMSIDRAVTAMRKGAQDFLVKPVSEERLLLAIDHACRSLQRAEVTAPGPASAVLPGFVGLSDAVVRLNAQLKAAAECEAPVLLWGEQGTGKGLAARTIHLSGPRPDGPMIVANCASLTTCDLPWLVPRATGGTLFLSRISELAPACLRQLHDRLCVPDRPRLIFSTTLNPPQADEQLRAVLGAVPEPAIRIPPLRERRADILPLARAFMARQSAQNGRAFTQIAPSAEAILQAHDWPGNVRQLRGVIAAIATLHDGEAITAAMLPVEMRPPPSGEAVPDTLAGLTLTEIERIAIERAIERHEGSVPRASDELDVAPSTIYRKMGLWRRN